MFELPDLPYDHAALEPVISRATMHLHHEKHHQTYLDTVNQLLGAARRFPASLEEVVQEAAGDAASKTLFNNAAQAWNHGFFWNAMTPRGAPPSGPLASAIDRDFGGFAALKARFVEEGATHFGSGWVWLAAEGEAVKVMSTHDGDDLLTHSGLTPLLVCDLWEHAYYLDHRNDRRAFLKAWFDALPNWALARRQYAASRGEGEVWRYPAPVAPDQGTAAQTAR